MLMRVCLGVRIAPSRGKALLQNQFDPKLNIVLAEDELGETNTFRHLRIYGSVLH